MQGVVINDKHIETIVRQMLKKLKLKNLETQNYLTGELIDKLTIRKY